MSKWHYGNGIIRDEKGVLAVVTMDHDGLTPLLCAAPDLLEACKGALAALTQNKTFPADIEAAKGFLSAAISKAEERES